MHDRVTLRLLAVERREAAARSSGSLWSQCGGRYPASGGSMRGRIAPSTGLSACVLSLSGRGRASRGVRLAAGCDWRDYGSFQGLQPLVDAAEALFDGAHPRVKPFDTRAEFGSCRADVCLEVRDRGSRRSRVWRAGGAVADRVHPAVGLVARLGEAHRRVAAAGDHGHAGRRRQSHRHTSRRSGWGLRRARRSGARGMPARRLPFGMPRLGPPARSCRSSPRRAQRGKKKRAKRARFFPCRPPG